MKVRAGEGWHFYTLCSGTFPPFNSVWLLMKESHGFSSRLMHLVLLESVNKFAPSQVLYELDIFSKSCAILMQTYLVGGS